MELKGVMNLMKKKCAIYVVLRKRTPYLFLADIQLAVNVSKFISRIGNNRIC